MAAKTYSQYHSRCRVRVNGGTATITVPLTLARMMIHCLAEQAFARAGWLFSMRQAKEAKLMSEHAIALGQLARQLPKGDNFDD